MCSASRASRRGLQARPRRGPGAYQPGAYPPPPMGAPNPGTATILGFIPGVGAMYNGQYIKAIVHVLVFVVLICDHRALRDVRDFCGRVGAVSGFRCAPDGEGASGRAAAAGSVWTE